MRSPPLAHPSFICARLHDKALESLQGSQGSGPGIAGILPGPLHCTSVGRFAHRIEHLPEG